MFKFFIFTSFFILFFSNSSFTQINKDIIPMHSKCEDVKKVYNIETCKKPHETYNFPNEIVRVSYSTNQCQLAYGKKWNIPIGTVTSVVISFKEMKKLNDFGIDLNKCSKTDITSDAFKENLYECKEYGINLYIVENNMNEFVNTIIYIPTPEDYSCLLCK